MNMPCELCEFKSEEDEYGSYDCAHPDGVYFIGGSGCFKRPYVDKNKDKILRALSVLSDPNIANYNEKLTKIRDILEGENEY
jgi:hypothetical protein